MKFNWPGHNYLGPGNPLNNGKPVDKDDEIAEKHDWAYHNSRTTEDVRAADKTAIKEFTSDFLSTGNYESAIGAAGLGLKFIGESVIGVQYPNLASTSTPKPNTRARDQARREFFHDLHQSAIQSSSEEGSTGDTAGSMNPADVPESDANTSDGPSRSIRAGSGPGAGSVGAGGSAGLVPIYRGIFQPPNRFQMSFRKEYRFFMQTSKSGYWTGNPTVPGGDQYVHLRIGSVHDIPWDRFAMYVSPREAALLRTQFTKVTVEGVNVEVHSMGVRLPFETNAGVATVANANVQMPLIEMFNIDQYYYTNTSGAKIDAMFNQMIGTTIYPPNITTEKGEEGNPELSFDNITAMFETREFDNPLHILLPRPARRTNETSFALALREYHNEPQYTMAITNSANGSNHLGKLFQRQYKPKNGVIFQHCTNQTYTTMVNAEGDEYNVQLPDLHRNVNGPTLENEEDYILWWNSEYRRVRVENDLNVNVTDPLGVSRMPRFPIGMYNLRNAMSVNQDIVKAQWEFILVCEMNVTCENGVKGVYNRNMLAPETQHIYPAVRPGNKRRRVDMTMHNERRQFNRPTLTELDAIPPQWINDAAEVVDYVPPTLREDATPSIVQQSRKRASEDKLDPKKSGPEHLQIPLPTAPLDDDIVTYKGKTYPVESLRPNARTAFLAYLSSNPSNVKTVDDYFTTLMK